MSTISPKKLFLLPLIITICSFGFFLKPTVVHACTPCLLANGNSTYSLSETAHIATDIIVGQQIAYNPEEKEPATIRVLVQDVLKGSVRVDEELTIQSYKGMCPYGIVIDDQQYVLFLIQETSDLYDAVGCGVKALPLIDGYVVVEGQGYSLSQFRMQLSEILHTSVGAKKDNHDQQQLRQEETWFVIATLSLSIALLGLFLIGTARQQTGKKRKSHKAVQRKKTPKKIS